MGAREQAVSREELAITLFEESGDALLFDPESESIIDVNPMAERMSGFSYEELLPMQVTYLFRSHVQGGLCRLRNAFKRTGLFQSQEDFLLRTKKDRVWIPANLTVTRLHARSKTLGLITARDVSEHRRLEEKVTRLAAIVRYSDNAIVAKTLDGIVTDWNAGAERLYGYEAQEMIGKHVGILVPADRAQETSTIMERICLGQRVETFDTLRRRKDGAVIDVAVTVSPIRGKTDQIVGASTIAQDLSSRKRMEKELQQAAAELRVRADLAEMAADVGGAIATGGKMRAVLQACAAAVVRHVDAASARIWTLNERTNVLELQATAGVATDGDGAHRDIPVGQSAIGVIAQERKPHLTNCIDGDPRVPDPEWAAREGLSAFAGYPLMAESRVVGVAALFARHELSEIALAALASVAHVLAVGILRQQGEDAAYRLAAIVQSSDDAVVGEAPDGTIVSWNPAAERLYGYTADEIIGRKIFTLVPPEHEYRVRAMLERIRLGEQVTPFEEPRRHKDGRLVPVSVSRSAIRDRDGQIIGTAAFHRNVSGRLRLEEEVRQSQKMEAIGQLAGGVAHDFNNLLTVINGYSEMLLGTPQLNVAARPLVEEIRKAGERSASLTAQLLAFSRRQVLEPKVLNLNERVKCVEKMLNRLIGEGVTLTAVLDPDLGHVKADPGQIDQVLINLAVNARDAMPQGGSLTVETANVLLDESYAASRPEVWPGPYVLLAISDTGVGMDERTKAHIFEPFFTTKGPGNGTGLGLAVVHGVITQSGGHVAVYSELGRGTTFKVYLPRVETLRRARKSHPGIETVPKGSGTVLLVEDEAGVRKLARHSLEMAGYTVLEACHGGEGVRVAEKHQGPIHLLVSDVVMPEMGGRLLADRVTALRPGTKVLFLSGYTDDAVIRHGILGADINFLQKPFTPASLARKVREVLEN